MDGCPCGETQIKLFKGSNSEQYQTMSSHLLVYLKGSKKNKEVKHPNLYQHFEDIWSVRHRHMVTGLPQAYIFFLRCCYEQECIHPKCRQNPVACTSTWYPGGPSLSHIPLPVHDPQRPWGDPQCSSCKGTCSGHYSTQLVNTADSEMMKSVDPQLF